MFIFVKFNKFTRQVVSTGDMKGGSRPHPTLHKGKNGTGTLSIYV